MTGGCHYQQPHPIGNGSSKPQSSSPSITSTSFPMLSMPMAKTLVNDSIGHWLLIEPSSSAINHGLLHVHNLQTFLFAHYQLTSFHVLNPAACKVMIRLQSIEEALQLKHDFGDRLLLEPISDMDARMYLHQLGVS